MSLTDFAWSAATGPVVINHIIVYEDGPQPRDEHGRFRKRRVLRLDPVLKPKLERKR